METISSMASAARNSVVGDMINGKSNNSNNDTSNKSVGEVTEPPSGGDPGKGMPDAPFDPGNTPEQATLSKVEAQEERKPEAEGWREGGKGKAAGTEAATSPSSSPSPTTTTGEGPTAAKKTTSGTAKPGSHSALFGLGPSVSKAEVEGKKDGSGGLSGTIEEAGKEMGRQAELEKNRNQRKEGDGERGKETAGGKGGEGEEEEEEEACGYMGLKKAAMEEAEKKKKRLENGGAGADGGEWTSAAADVTEDEDRDPRSPSKKLSLGRDVSPGEMPDGTHRKSIAELPSHSHSHSHSHHFSAAAAASPLGHHFGRRAHTTNVLGGDNGGNGGSGGVGFRDKLKDKFRSKK